MATRDIDYMSELRAAMTRRPSVMANLLLFAIVAFFVAATVWAAVTEVDQVSTGDGRVMPSRRVQVVQNLEGGIVAELSVREGDEVTAGQILMQLDDTRFSSEFGENQMKLYGLQAATARLEAEVAGTAPRFSADVEAHVASIVAGERALYAARASELEAGIARLRAQLVQHRQEIAETEARIVQLETAIGLAREEIAILEPLVKRGINAPVELIRLRRELSRYVGDLAVARESIARQTAAIEESEQEIRELRARFQSRALKELNEARVEMEALRQNLASRRDRLTRTVIRAPVDGTVKQLFANTIGGVVQPGMDLVEIVPAEEALVVEARVRPADIAFIHPGLKALVKFSAYDYTVYGAVPATLDHISADTITDEKTGESFYVIRVTAKTEDLRDRGGEPLPVIPGMTASVDVITGKRTVLQYLMTPIDKAFQGALRES